MLNGIIKGEKYEYDVILCRPNKEHIMFIEYSNLSYNPLYNQFSSLDITIAEFLKTDNGKKNYNPCWELIFANWLVYLQIRNGDEISHSEYFVIENPNFSGSEKNSKSFKCYSYEKLDFNNKLLDGFRNDVPKMLYDPNNTTDTDGLPLGVMNYICSNKLYDTWKVRHIDEQLLNLERIVRFSGNTTTNALTLLAERFGCVFVFDNIKMCIDIFQNKIGVLGENKGFVVADDNYMKSIEYTEDSSGLKTRLYINGKDNATIAQYNPTGQRYVDDFTFYMNDKYMSKSLQDALEIYNTLVESKTGLFEAYVDRLNAGDSSVMPLIEELQNSLLWENNFTEDQIKELVPFIHEEIKTVNEISDEKQLYEYALKYLKTISFIPVQISIQIIDIFAIEKFQQDWDKLTKVGDFLNIYYKPFNLEYKEMRLVSYTHNPVSNTLQLEFSNIDELITRQQEDYNFINTISDISTTLVYEQDSYRSFDRERDVINTKIDNIYTGNLKNLPINQIINSNKNRIQIINGGIGFLITRIDGAVETPVLYLDENGYPVVVNG